ncbi:hypothetical protein J2X72_001387 [Phyllobacterium sp. 1468]|nr:hypothetical protein [Phyllobacterium sp. 1468]
MESGNPPMVRVPDVPLFDGAATSVAQKPV